MAERKDGKDDKRKSEAGPPRSGGPGARFRQKERPKDLQGTVLRIWGYLGRQRKALVIALILVAASSGADVLGPYLMGRTIDRYILAGDMPGLARMALLMLAVYAGGALVSWLQVYVMAAASQKAVNGHPQRPLRQAPDALAALFRPAHARRADEPAHQRRREHQRRPHRRRHRPALQRDEPGGRRRR